MDHGAVVALSLQNRNFYHLLPEEEIPPQPVGKIVLFWTRKAFEWPLDLITSQISIAHCQMPRSLRELLFGIAISGGKFRVNLKG